MSSANEKLTALANEVRELSGTTTTKGIDTMISDIDAANAEIAGQVALISQITAALEGKAAGGSGVELPELDNPASASDILSGKEAIDENGEIITGTIATKTSSNLTSSGATVTVPAGYYASNATKSISTGSAKTPATTVTKNPTISVSASGLISASISGTQSVTPTVTAGYVSSGTSGTITVSGSATKQLTTQAAKTVTPTTSSQTAVASGRYTTGAVTVGPIPSNYEDVGTETTEYTSLASQLEAAINSLPEAGTGGGSGEGVFNTCTVTGAGSLGVYLSFDNDYSNEYLRPYIYGAGDFIVPKGIKILVPNECSSFPVSITPTSSVTMLRASKNNTATWYQLNDSCTLSWDD